MLMVSTSTRASRKRLSCARLKAPAGVSGARPAANRLSSRNIPSTRDEGLVQQGCFDRPLTPSELRLQILPEKSGLKALAPVAATVITDSTGSPAEPTTFSETAHVDKPQLLSVAVPQPHTV